MSNQENSIDALIVGAGFSGLMCLYKFRKEGFSAKIYEAGSDLGGTWYWNRYPGARVDSDTQIYQLPQEDIWKSFNWTERFPGQAELQDYFHYADSKLGFSKDIHYDTRVTAATFDKVKKQWFVEAENGKSIWANHLVLCTGFASKRYTPPFKGLESFKGICHHSNLWPTSGVDLKSKRVAVIGTGASGVQIIQEIGPIVSHLTVYQRTPNIALPMQQLKAPQDDSKWKDPSQTQEEIFEVVRKTFAGFNMDFTPQKGEEVSLKERRALFEDLYKRGGFSLWLATYKDVFFNPSLNDDEYAFWAEKTRARINDPVKRELLAPLQPPHAFGTKRPCLEQAYYEVYNQPNVDLINVRDSPILEITPEGVKTQKEGLVPIDVLILATGFDSVTGGILNIQIKNGDGETIQDKWKSGTWTSMGICTSGFPNMYFLYGPHAPTAFSNGPTTGGIQSDWITQLMVSMREQRIQALAATPESESEWTKEVRDIWASSLFPAADSWYQGANIPGKPREALNYFGGIPNYIKALDESARKNYENFTRV